MKYSLFNIQSKLFLIEDSNLYFFNNEAWQLVKHVQNMYEARKAAVLASL